MMKTLRIVLIFACLAALAACGKKGELTLPPPQEAAAVSAKTFIAAA